MIITKDVFGVRRRERLADVARLSLESESEHAYLQDIVDDVADRMGTPFATIEVLLDFAQVFLSSHGPVPAWIAEAGGTPIEWALCVPLVSAREPRAVADLTQDPMFRDNPLVRVGGLRATAGAPLISSRGEVLGGLCCHDVVPHRFGADDLGFLQAAAAEAVARIEQFAPFR